MVLIKEFLIMPMFQLIDFVAIAYLIDSFVAIN